MITDMNLNDLVSNSLDYFNTFIENNKLKKFRRKFRRNGKITYTKYLITYNPVRDFMFDTLSFNLKMFRRFIESRF